MAITNSKTTAVPIAKGTARKHRVTKELLRIIRPGCIAVIDHDDLDDLAAEGLIAAGVTCVVNAGQTMTGTAPVTGPLLLLERGVPVMEIEGSALSFINDDEELTVTAESITAGKRTIPCAAFTRERWLYFYKQAHHGHHERLREFIDNTLAYADKEKDLVLKPLYCPELRVRLEGRHVLVVTRGRDYKQDLAALNGYIEAYAPVFVGVDGGADALLEQGYRPDLIIGDMDSASDRALRCGAELVVHAYPDGEAPGLGRIRKLGLEAAVLSSCGTSEDIALLLAYDHQCEKIVTVGGHSHMFDFLEKGRKGMGSTVLVRMKIGSKLTDAKGIALLNCGLDKRLRKQALWKKASWKQAARSLLRKLRISKT
ncbi:thiamine pyrophosphokinase, catalytic domain [Paenibacillus konkukensis]|uniref:Thiamine pyrophosphokinase, catalytic domain n=1 Tax=Paenibacillus konkukensis TaxID=2020716 RepID=A0ABY4RKP5_9BACL|nr:putative cytokinetic ring protein SteA [Paenibacillus konkukensis]UQZ82034.1 thiamine pyrophosphokinase, catalytic domain [Paenibacillus konkukensis]